MKKKIIIIICYLTLIVYPVNAQQGSSETVIKSNIKLPDNYIVNSDFRLSTDRPQVAVALSGGGARALVNVGILKALEEAEVPIDLVVGSSMGSIVAVMYGSGMPIEQIERTVTEVAIPEMFAVNLPVVTPLLSSEEFNVFLEDLVPKDNLADFPLPTAVLSYNLTRETKYIFVSGPVSKVISTSYGLPFSFPVRHWKEAYFMDAGFQETVPAKAASLLGADIIISTTASDELPYTDYDTPLRSLTRMITLVKEKNSQRIVEKYSDVVINTEVGDYSFMDFQLASEFVGIGYQAAQKQLPLIKSQLEEAGIDRPFKRRESVVDLDNLLSDINYNRRPIENFSLRPKVYWGTDNSYFKPKLFKDRLLCLQYEIKGEYDKLELKLLGNRQAAKVETKLRWKKLSERTDLIIRNNFSASEGNVKDILIDLKYYQPDYTVSGGAGIIDSEALVQIKNYYQLQVQQLALNSENNLLARPGEAIEWGYLLLEEVTWQLPESLQLNLRLVVDQTELIDSPTIYRGPEASEDSLTQASLELNYKYQFPYSLEIMNVFQGRGLEVYGFTDYQSTANKQAVGLGTNLNFHLLGIKPLQLGATWAYDYRSQREKLACIIDMKF